MIQSKNSDTPVTYLLLELPDGNQATFIGGPPIPDGPRHLWLTHPDGRRALRVLKSRVRISSAKEVKERIAADLRSHQAG